MVIRSYHFLQKVFKNHIDWNCLIVYFTYTYDAGSKTLTMTYKDGDKPHSETASVSFDGAKATVKFTKADEDGSVYVMILKKI